MEFLNRYKYPIVGGLIGLILVSLIMTLGFWKTILLILAVGIFAYLGALFQDSGLLEAIANRMKR
ncbi:DUF2273 domain-containing protein [Streptococcus rifensis]